MIRPPLPLLLLLLASACGEAPEPIPVQTALPEPEWLAPATVEELEQAFPALVDRARHELSKAHGLSVDDLNFEIADRSKLLDTLVANLGHQSLDDSAVPERDALRPMARGLAGIYSMDEKKVLVVLDNLQFIAETFDRPEILNGATLYGLLAHEGGHAVADRKYGLLQLIGRCSTAEQLYAANGVIEGYAQYAGRQACPEEWMALGFDQLAEVIAGTPDIEDPAQRMVVAMTVAQFSFGYVQGEAFVRAIAAARGAAGLASLFEQPPTSRNQVANPEWYLDPTKAPQAEFQLEAALDTFEEHFADHSLQFQRLDFDKTMLRTAASPLAPAELEQMVAAVRQSRVIAGGGFGPAGQIIAVAALHACVDDAAADTYVAMSEKLMEAKEAMVKDSATPIKESSRTPVHGGEAVGFSAIQVVDNQGSDLGTRSLILRRGALAVEITLIQLEVEEQELIDLGSAMLAAGVAAD